MTDVLDLKNPLPIEDVGPVALAANVESVEWTAEHQTSERERMREYGFLAGAVIVGGAVAYWQASWLTFAVIILCVAAWEVRNRLPSRHQIKIDDQGVSVDGYRHRYEHLRSYDMHTMPDGTARLSLKTRRLHLPDLHIPLNDQNPEAVHGLLSQYLLRDEHRIPLVDYLLKK